MRTTLFKFVGKATPEQRKAFTIGWCSGIIYMSSAQTLIMGRMIKRYKRNQEFVGHVMEDCWVYLPPEVKDKFITEAQFYNITLEENI